MDQYTRVLNPTKVMRDRLSVTTQQALLERVVYRAEWEKLQEQKRADAEAAADREKRTEEHLSALSFVTYSVCVSVRLSVYLCGCSCDAND